MIMAIRAQIENGTVVNLIEVDPGDVPDWCAGWPDGEGAFIGWTYNDADGTFAAPPVPEPSQIEATALITYMIDAAAVEITGEVPEVERLSWTAKEQAARAYREGRGSDYMLETEAGLTGETLDDLTAKIIRNADLYRSVVAAMTGIRRSALNHIASGGSTAEIVERVRTELAALINPK